MRYFEFTIKMKIIASTVHVFCITYYKTGPSACISSDLKNSILSYYLPRPITTFCQTTQEQDNTDWIRTGVEMSHIYDLFINACNEYND